MSKNVVRQLNCNGCVACCINENITIPKKLRDQYETEVNDKGKTVLAHKEDGRCHYLTDDGCSIYERRPPQCKAFSCVWLMQRVGVHEMKKLCHEPVIFEAIIRLRQINRDKNIKRQNMLYKKPPGRAKVIKRNWSMKGDDEQ